MNRGTTIVDNIQMKCLKSDNYNFIYDKDSGFFVRWGKTEEEDPSYSLFGPEIVDIEISTICNGVNNKPCKFCYKSNSGRGYNMSLDTFKKVFEKLPKIVTQIAFGLGDLDANPDRYLIFEHCRANGVVPNVTINGDRLSDGEVKELVRLCGAVAVSRYEPKDVCYNAVKKLTDSGMNQVNIHHLVCEETYDQCLETVKDAVTDERLKGLKAIVFLALKQRGRGESFNPMRSTEKYRKLVDLAMEQKIAIGFDSCSASKFLKCMEGHKDYKQFEVSAEPCESTLFSIYIDVFGKAFPCSFLEDSNKGVSVTNCEDFIKDVWFGEELSNFRKRLLVTAQSDNCLVKGCRQCPVYEI